MGEKKYKKGFVDLRGRWEDNKKLVRKLIDYASNDKDWTELIGDILCKDSRKNVRSFKHYKNPPDLRMINLDELDISDITLRNANLLKATFFRSQANRLKFIDCYAMDTKWAKATMFDSIFENIDFRHSNFSNVNLSNSKFINCNLSHCYFSKAILQNVCFHNTNLTYSNFSEADIDNSSFDTVKLYGSSLWDIKYNKINCRNIDLSKLGNDSVVSDDIRLAPLIHLLEDDKLADIIGSLKSNTVVILGSDSSSESMNVLNKIGERAKEWGLTPIIIKNIKDTEGQSFTQKAIMYSLLAKFVIIENSKASGHILEFDKVLNLNCIVGVLQEKDKGSTHLLDEYFIRYPFHLHQFVYDDNFEQKIKETYEWCVNQQKELSVRLKNIYEGLK